MVIVIFRSRLRPEFIDEYRELAPNILELARSVPGFISFKSFTSDDNERVSIIEFESHQALESWRNHPEHLHAQTLGRERFYAEYHLQVCEPIRAYAFQDGVRTDHT